MRHDDSTAEESGRGGGGPPAVTFDPLTFHLRPHPLPQSAGERLWDGVT